MVATNDDGLLISRFVATQRFAAWGMIAT